MASHYNLFHWHVVCSLPLDTRTIYCCDGTKDKVVAELTEELYYQA